MKYINEIKKNQGIEVSLIYILYIKCNKLLSLIDIFVKIYLKTKLRIYDMSNVSKYKYILSKPHWSVYSIKLFCVIAESEKTLISKLF